MELLSVDSQAIVLLNAYLSTPKNDDIKPLTPTEYGRFAKWLHENNIVPGDLLNKELSKTLAGWDDPKITFNRLERLINRGAALGVAVDKWQRSGIWIMTRLDPEYPQRLKRKLGLQAPAVFFGCGSSQRGPCVQRGGENRFDRRHSRRQKQPTT